MSKINYKIFSEIKAARRYRSESFFTSNDVSLNQLIQI